MNIKKFLSIIAITIAAVFAFANTASAEDAAATTDPQVEVGVPPVPGQVIVSQVVLYCPSWVRSGVVELSVPESEDVMLSISVPKVYDVPYMGPVVTDTVIPAGTTRYEFTLEQIIATQALINDTKSTPVLEGHVTRSDGSTTTFEVSYQLDNEMCVRSLATYAECTNFRVTNTGNVRTLTLGNDVGYSFGGSALPPYLIALQPGEYIDILVEEGQTLNFAAGDYTVTDNEGEVVAGSEIRFTGGCTLSTADRGPTIFLGPSDAPPPLEMLPATGATQTNLVILALALVIVGGLLLRFASRRPVGV